MSYEPQPDSLAAKVVGFLRRAPDAELSIEDVATKFPPVQTRAVTACLNTPTEHGMLKRVRNEAGVIVYRAGPKLSPQPAPRSTTAQAPAQASSTQAPASVPSAPPAPPAPPETPAAAPQAAAPVVPTTSRPSARGRFVRLPEIDLAALPVRRDVPIPMKKQALKGKTRYDAVFDGLKEPGDSRGPMDIAYYQTLVKAAKVYSKERGVPLLVRRIDDKTCGVWRDAGKPTTKGATHA